MGSLLDGKFEIDVMAFGAEMIIHSSQTFGLNNGTRMFPCTYITIGVNRNYIIGNLILHTDSAEYRLCVGK